MLDEIALSVSDRPMPPRVAEFIREGRSRSKSVNCFDFVPSDYELAWQVLAALAPSRFCEWGSGLGIVTGLAGMLGFDACGIEIDESLAAESRRLLADFQLACPIETGDYLASRQQADVYFVYCWPSRMATTQEHFDRIAPRGARLLICHGQSDIRCVIANADGSAAGQ